jgi:hypothetical protein
MKGSGKKLVKKSLGKGGYMSSPMKPMVGKKNCR